MPSPPHCLTSRQIHILILHTYAHIYTINKIIWHARIPSQSPLHLGTLLTLTPFTKILRQTRQHQHSKYLPKTPLIIFNSSELNPPLSHWTNKHHHCNLHKKVYIRHNYHRIGNTVGKDIRNTTAANLVPSSPFSQIQSDSHTHPTYILTHFRKLIKIITQNYIDQPSTRPTTIICCHTGKINITTAISIKYCILDILDIVSALKPAQIFEIPPPPACYRHHPIVKSYQINIPILHTYVHISEI